MYERIIICFSISFFRLDATSITASAVTREPTNRCSERETEIRISHRRSRNPRRCVRANMYPRVPIIYMYTLKLLIPTGFFSCQFFFCIGYPVYSKSPRTKISYFIIYVTAKNSNNDSLKSILYISQLKTIPIMQL